MPKISIVIPVCNVAPCLRACLDSVLAAVRALAEAEGDRAAAVEAVCVDDGSTDASGAILDGYAAAARAALSADRFGFRVIHREHAGTGEARNAGLAAATGEWILFLDGDDVLAPFALERLVPILGNCGGETRLVRFGYREFRDGEPCAWTAPCGAVPRRTDVSKRIAWDDFYVYMWQFAYRRDLIDGVRFQSYRRGQDRLFVDTVLLSRADSFLDVGEDYYGYRLRAGSSTHSRASAAVLKDELSHRVAVIEAVDASGKDVSYRQSWWLEECCVRKYLERVWERRDGSPVYDAAARRELVAWYARELPRLRRARGFSRQTKLALFLHGLFFRCVGPDFVAFNCLLPLERLAILVANPGRLPLALWRRLQGRLGLHRREPPGIQLVTQDSDLCDAGAKAPRDAAVIAERAGFRRLRVSRPMPADGGRSAPHLVLWLAKCLFYCLRVPRRSLVFAQFPGLFGVGRMSACLLVLLRKLRRARVITLVHDVDVLRGMGFGGCRAGLDAVMQSVVAASDVLIVHNAAMRKWFEANGVPGSRLVELGLFDYLAPDASAGRRTLTNEIAIAGSLSPEKAAYLARLSEIRGLKWNLFGPAEGGVPAGDAVAYCGCHSPEELPRRLRGSFGLVWNGDSVDTCCGRAGEYLRYNNPHKLSLYLAAGLPVIVWSRSAPADFVRSNRLGLCVDSLREIPAALSALDPQAYDRLCANAARLSRRLRAGAFLAAALDFCRR